MTFGFVIIRHVCSKQTDLYWKESYKCIRKHYPNTHIMIVDDSSNREFLVENIVLTNCTVIYDTQNKGAAEFLPYYYFHLLHPFDTAVIIQDGIFIQEYVDFEGSVSNEEPCRFLWEFSPIGIDNESLHVHVHGLLAGLPTYHKYAHVVPKMDSWNGCFGVMSIIRWEFLNHVNQTDRLFDAWLPIVRGRGVREALERAFAIVMKGHLPNVRSLFGCVFHYMPWGTTLHEYLASETPIRPLAKVWTGR